MAVFVGAIDRAQEVAAELCECNFRAKAAWNMQGIVLFQKGSKRVAMVWTGSEEAVAAVAENTEVVVWYVSSVPRKESRLE